jgi:hypothetical protein
VTIGVIPMATKAKARVRFMRAIPTTTGHQPPGQITFKILGLVAALADAFEPGLAGVAVANTGEFLCALGAGNLALKLSGR